jgi:hypothetical protein
MTPSRLIATSTNGGAASASVMLGLLVLALGIRITLFSGVSGDDDLSIAHAALNVLRDGIAWPEAHYQARWGLILPQSAIFGLLGVGQLQLAIIPLAFSLGGVWLAMRFAQDAAGRTAAVMAGLVLALYPLDIQASTQLFPDAPQGVCLAATIWCALRAGSARRPWLWVVAAGLFWGWSYYIKIDGPFLIMPLAWLCWQGRIAPRHLAGLCAVTGLAVGAELVVYGLHFGDPFYRLTLEARAAAEVLNPAHTFLDRSLYLQAAFLKPTTTALHLYALLAAVCWCFATRARPFYYLVVWVAVFAVWLQFGGNPFDERVSIKPQLARYLLVFAAPMAVLIGGFLAWLWARSRTGFALTATPLFAAALILSLLLPLGSERPAATREGMDLAWKRGWIPIYLDHQSFHMATLLYGGRDMAMKPLQRHDFLAGQTRQFAVTEDHAYALINEGNVRALQRTSMVQPPRLDRSAFRIEQVATIDNPAPPASYAALRLLRRAASLLPASTLRERLLTGADETLAGSEAVIYRLDRRYP